MFNPDQIVIDELLNYIVWPYLIMFMLVSYLIKGMVKRWLKGLTDIKWRTKYTVFVIALITGIFFYISFKPSWVDLIITYALGTSLHELVFSYLESKLKHKK